MRFLWIAAFGLGACTEDGLVSPSSSSSSPSDATADAGPTYHQDVAPILAERCGGCHRPDGLGPFSIADYATAAEWAEPMIEAVEDGRMPPYFAEETDECDMRLGLKDDPRLSDEEKATLRAWVDAGAPEGDPAAASAAPLGVIDHLEDVDVELELPEPFEVEGDQDIYQCFRIPLPEIEADRWITALEVLPDNDRVVHHVLVWNDPTDSSRSYAGSDGSYRCSGFPEIWPTELIGIWTPGSDPTRSPADTGTLVHPGGSIVIDVHYHPTGNTTEVDRTKLVLKWTDEQPAWHATWFLIDLPFGASVEAGPEDRGGPEFRIPANASAHRESVALTIPPYLSFDLPIFAITPHMHYLGSEMLVTLDRETGDDECLIHTPQYRFDYQTMYTYDAEKPLLPIVHVGDTVRVRCTYDNSPSARFMPDHLDAAGLTEPADVYWGEETADEMCTAMVGLILPPADWLEVLSGVF